MRLAGRHKLNDPGAASRRNLGTSGHAGLRTGTVTMNDQKLSTNRVTAANARETRTRALIETNHKTSNAQRGSDPYNTSGSFDRKKNWARVGKR
jgi:hypothetical protein